MENVAAANVLSSKSWASRLNQIMLLASSLCLIAVFYFNGTFSIGLFQPKQPDDQPKVSGGGPANKTTATTSVSNIVTDAMAFYNTLSATQQSTLQLTYTTALARKWSNLPCGTSCRSGLQLGTNLTTAQYTAAMKIIQDALGTTANNGYDEFHQMNLAEAYLHANGGGSGYDSVLRWMAFLGTPSTSGAWMLQFGGHHYAANIAFNNGHVIGATPFFMGLEPKTFTYNAVAYDPLGDERTALCNALSSLSSTQLTTALISSSFSDCVMIPGETNGGAATFPAVAIGQPLSSLTAAQQNLVLDAIKLYVNDMDTATANHVLAGYTSELSSTYISYHGSGSTGSASSFLVAQGDYARISGPNVWIEFSCQGGIVIAGQIHYHTVWRDRSHDYGVDLTGSPIDGTSSATNVAAVDNKKTFTLYPNPATDQISLAFNGAIAHGNISITNAVTGQLVRVQKDINSSFVQFDIADLPSGNYILKVEDKAGVYLSKFSKH